MTINNWQAFQAARFGQSNTLFTTALMPTCLFVNRVGATAHCLILASLLILVSSLIVCLIRRHRFGRHGAVYLRSKALVITCAKCTIPIMVVASVFTGKPMNLSVLRDEIYWDARCHNDEALESAIKALKTMKAHYIGQNLAESVRSLSAAGYTCSPVPVRPKILHLVSGFNWECRYGDQSNRAVPRWIVLRGENESIVKQLLAVDDIPDE